MIKKKIFDLFIYHEQENLNPRSTPTASFNNYGNFTFPNVTGHQNYTYTGQTNAQQQNNQSLSSGFQNYGFKNQASQDHYSPFSPNNSSNSG